MYCKQEREVAYAQIIRQVFGNDLSKRKIIEIGAGTGGNLLFFQYLGFQWGNIYANELLEERYNLLKMRILPQPSYTIATCVEINDLQELAAEVCIHGDALQLPYKEKFDVALQSTVFTSILDENFRKALAEKMWDMLKPGGIILSYDFTYNNPNNKDVRKLTKKEIKNLFPNHRGIQFKSVTLAPPIARRVGKFYNLINFLFPMLRTHLIAAIKK
ncbi:MAG: class I SAM-dependent methyltransferase [Dysgonamonadaceae bacterium]|nr:class I SAM-dependent methyltransferase [Dysgonamonadaceae bacterium]